MSKYDWDDNSRRTYTAAKKQMLTYPKNSLGEGLAGQMIDEAKTNKRRFSILGIGLMVLAKALQKHPEQVDGARKILGK